MKIRNNEMIDAKKKNMIQIAEQIIIDEGIDKLSIRKIATKLNQTPGIIYHYFKSKDDILLAIVNQGYKEILDTIISCEKIEDPQKRLYDTLYSYMNLMIKKNRLFMIMLQSDVEEIKKYVNVLECSVKDRKSISMLSSTIENGIKIGKFQCYNVELRAKTIWASVYGLISRIINENIDDELKEKLINDQLIMIITSLRGEK